MLRRRLTDTQDTRSRAQMQERDARKGMWALLAIILFILLGLGVYWLYLAGLMTAEQIGVIGSIFAVVSAGLALINKKTIGVFVRSLASTKASFCISYHIVDYRWAKWMAGQFEAAGYSAFIQEWDGEEAFGEMKRTALKKARAVLTLLSPEYIDLFGSDAEELGHFLHLHGDGGRGLLVRVRTFVPEPRIRTKICLDLVGKHEEQARDLLLELASEHARPDIAQQARTPVAAETRYPGNLPEVWNVPTRNPFFTGRECILSNIHTTFLQNRVSQPLRPQAVTGISGLGKTQIAVEYAYLYHQQYTYVLWLHLPPHLKYAEDLKLLAKLLNVAEGDGQSQIEGVKDWLRTHADWLFVLDQYSGQQRLENFLPEAPRGFVLLTTSADFLDKEAQQIPLEEMDEQEGALFLLRRAEIVKPDESLVTASEAHRRLAREIVQEMGGFPQALDYAGAYIRKVKCPLAEYLQLYRTRHLELLKFCLQHVSEPEQARGDAPVIDRTPEVYTWVISYKEIESKIPAAAQLLQFCSFLAPEAIPVEILRKAPALSPELQDAARDPLQLNRVIMELLRFSLLDRDRETDTLSLNRIVQVYLKDQMDETTRKRLSEQVICAVGQAFPAVAWQNLQVCEQQYAPQAAACLRLLEHWPQLYPNEPQPASADVRQLYLRYGSYLRERAMWNDAKLALEQAMRLGTGTPDGDTACAYQLAELCYQCAEYTEAERLYQAAGAANQPLERARVLIGLARLYTDQRQTDSARACYAEAVIILEHVPTDISQADPALAVDILDYLAGAYEYLGRVSEAGKLLEQALKGATAAWGNDTTNQRILFLQTNLVRYRYQYHYRFASGLPDEKDKDYARYRHAVNLSRQALGDAHPQVLLRIVNLAGVCELRGDATEAQRLYEEAVCLYDEGPPRNLKNAHAKMIYAHFLRLEAAHAKAADGKRKLARAGELERQAQAIYAHYGISISG